MHARTGIAILLASAAAAGQENAGQVIVTAQKRSEALQDVPMSVSALEAKDIERMGLSSVSDLSHALPGLTVLSAGAGQNILIVRGIASSAGTAGTVGYYIDETPVSASSNASLLAIRGVVDPAMFDLQRVELLRGPQGTLYGSSSMGGTVRYITAQPSLTQSLARIDSRLSMTTGGSWNRMLGAVINTPLQQSALRLAVSWRREGGYVDRYGIDPANYLGIAPGAAAQHAVNSEDSKDLRLAYKLQLSGGATLTASVLTQSLRQDAPASVDAPPGGLDRLLQTRMTEEPTKQDTSLANLTLHQPWGSFDLVSSTSYFARTVDITEDSSKVMYYFLSPKPQTSVVPIWMRGEYRNREWTQELRASSKGPNELIAGIYFHHVDAPLASSIPVPDGYNSRFGTNYDSFFNGGRHATVREMAMFGEASYPIMTQLRARAGLRAFRVSHGFFQYGDGVLNGGPSSVSAEASDRGFNPKFGLDWRAMPELLLYASTAKGYRAGGPNNPAPAPVCGGDVAKLGLSEQALRSFEADSLWSHELGAKALLPQQGLSINAAVYRMDWNKVQQQIVLGCGFNITANFGAARSEGEELEVAWAPSNGPALRFALTHNDARLGNDVPGTAAREGDSLLEVPHWSAAASGELPFQAWFGQPAYARLDWQYIGAANALYDRTSPYYHHAGYTQLNLRVGIDAARGKAGWSGALFVDNLGNRIGQTALPVAIAADLPTTRRLSVSRPRTVGMTASYHFR